MVAFVYKSPIFNIKHCLLEIKVFKGYGHLPISYQAIYHDIRHCFTETQQMIYEMNVFFFVSRGLNQFTFTVTVQQWSPFNNNKNCSTMLLTQTNSVIE